jgi:hypothetical protein
MKQAVKRLLQAMTILRAVETAHLDQTVDLGVLE